MRNTIRSLPLLLLVAASVPSMTACPGDNPGGEGEGEGGEGEGEGEALERVEEASIAVPAALQLSVGVALAVRSDGRAALAFAEEADNTVDCPLFGGGTTPSPRFNVLVADETSPGTFAIGTVDNPPAMNAAGIDIAVDPTSDALVVAYNGGNIPTIAIAGTCTAGDLMVAVETGPGTWGAPVFVAQAATTTSPCRDQKDPLCNEGDAVGRFPAIAIAPSGKSAIGYLDSHFGFGATDILKADGEIAVGTDATTYTLYSYATEIGAGNNSSAAFTDDDRAIVGQLTVASQVFCDENGQNCFTEGDGIKVVTEQSDGTFLNTVVADGADTDARVAVAYHPDVGIAVAYHTTPDEQLLVQISQDGGQTFPTIVPVERTGATGRSPQIGFLSDGTMVVAYGHCSTTTGASFCDPAGDGIKVALRGPQGGAFKSQLFKGGDEEADGIDVDMAIAPDDTIVVSQYNSTRDEFQVWRIRRK